MCHRFKDLHSFIKKYLPIKICCPTKLNFLHQAPMRNPQTAATSLRNKTLRQYSSKVNLYTGTLFVASSVHRRKTTLNLLLTFALSSIGILVYLEYQKKRNGLFCKSTNMTVKAKTWEIDEK
jgi:hypothetical protein